MHESVENCLKYLKRGYKRAEGRGPKILKRRGKLGQGVGTLKRGGELEPLKNYAYRKDFSWPHFDD